MKDETKNELDQNAVVEIEATELESIVDALRVRTGLQAGLIPCV